MNNETISVIVRTMPGRHGFLEKCLFLLSCQSYRNIEVIVVAQLTSKKRDAFDLSNVIDRWSAKLTSVQLISHESDDDARAKSLNLGKSCVSGRYVSFLDDDDKLYPDHYKMLIEALQDSDFAWAYSDCILAKYNEHGQLVSRSSPYRRDGYSFLDHLRGNFIPIHTFVIDRERVPDVPDVDERLSRTEDYEFLLRLAFSHEPLYVQGFSAEYCMRSDGSNTTPDGTHHQHLVSKKKREWDVAQMLVDDLKVQHFGWWVREVNALPMPYAGSHGLAATHAHTYRSMLRDYYDSTSWRVTRPIRNLALRLRGMPPERITIPSSEHEARAEIDRVLRSTSWEIAAPLRLIRRVLRRASLSDARDRPHNWKPSSPRRSRP